VLAALALLVAWALLHEPLGGAFLAAVGDGPTLAIRPNGAPYAAREPTPGELSRSCARQLDVLDNHARTLQMRPVLRGADLEAAAAARARVAVMSVEGGDFLEGRLENVQKAYDRGVRSVQLVHYRINELGDIQTEPPVHHRLTPFGRDVVVAGVHDHLEIWDRDAWRRELGLESSD
jgi:membrane dipeptidase